MWKEPKVSEPVSKADKVLAGLIKSARTRAKSKGIPFNIEVQDLVLPAFCPVLGIPLKVGAGTVSDNSPTIDRMDPARGYIRNNVAVISMRANRIKSNATLKELKQVYDWYSARHRS